MFASFNRFEIQMTLAQAKACSHSGACDADIAALVKSKKVHRPRQCTKENLAAELKEYGAWELNELADDAANWQRILWIAAGNIRDEH